MGLDVFVSVYLHSWRFVCPQLTFGLCVLRVVRPRLTIYVCQESQQAREQQHKHENGDGANNTFFGVSSIVRKACLQRNRFKTAYGNIFFLPSIVYHAIYLEDLTATELTEKLAQLFNISPRQIGQIFKQGPTGIHVLVSNEVQFYSFLWFYTVCFKSVGLQGQFFYFCYTLKTFRFEISMINLFSCYTT